MFHCSVIKVLSYCDSSFMLSHSSLSVKNFFNIFFDFFQSRKRRRRDLNPRAAINDLLPFQGSPFGQLGYFSKLPYLIGLLFSKALFIIPMHSIYVKHFLNIFHLFLTSLFTMPDQRREWDSNPRALADKRFSRPPRYDHFDTSPGCFARVLPN